MKEKKITIKLNGATQRQYSTILLELNLMKKAWKSYGVDINLSAPKLKAIINWGTKISEPFTNDRESSKRLQLNKKSKVQRALV